jgi:hypothetical protein
MFLISFLLNAVKNKTSKPKVVSRVDSRLIICGTTSCAHSDVLLAHAKENQAWVTGEFLPLDFSSTLLVALYR